MPTELKNNNPDINLIDARHQLHPWHSMGVENPNYMVASRAEGIYIFNEDLYIYKHHIHTYIYILIYIYIYINIYIDIYIYIIIYI